MGPVWRCSLVVVLAAAACSDERPAGNKAATHRGNAAAAQAIGSGAGRSEQDLQALVDSAYQAARQDFADPMLDADMPANPFVRSSAEWRQRIAGCSDGECRRQLLSDWLNRLQFAQGHATAPVSGMPWRTGAFRIREADVSGGLSLLPLADDKIMIRVDTWESGAARWMCDVIAYGRLDDGGSAQMTAVDDPGLRFELRSVGLNQLELQPLANAVDAPAVTCTTGRGTILGRYEARSGRQ